MEQRQLTPIKAIRAKCLDCCFDSNNEVKYCTVTQCSLWPYRLGRNPYRKEMTQEEKERAVANLRKRAPENREEKAETTLGV